MTTVTGYSPLHGGVNGYSLIDDQNPMERVLTTLFRKQSHNVVRELFDTLIGASAGATAASTYSRVKHDVTAGQTAEQGGAVAIETVTDINRVTTAADVTALKAIITKATTPTFPGDLSGNGK